MTAYAVFTDDEQACIAQKMRKLLKEDKPRDQAIAIAIRTCAPGKAKSMAGEPGRLPHQYRVRREGAVYRIIGIPIFATHTRQVFGRDMVFDLGWLVEAAVTAAVRAREDNFRAAVHVEHHDSAESRDRVGYLDRLRVGGPVLLGTEPNPVHVMFADLLIEGEANLDTARRLPFRSVEIADPGAASIDSLALMESQAPYFRFPHMQLAEAEPVQAAAVLYAARADGPGLSVLSNFARYQEETIMAEQEAEMPAAPAEEQPMDLGETLVKIMGAIDGLRALIEERLPTPEGAPEGERAPEEETGPVATMSARTAELEKQLGETTALALSARDQLKRLEQQRTIDGFVDGLKRSGRGFDEREVRQAAGVMIASPATWSAFTKQIDALAPRAPAESSGPAPAAIDQAHPVLKHWSHDPALYARAAEAYADEGNQMIIARARKNQTAFAVELVAGIVPGGRFN